MGEIKLHLHQVLQTTMIRWCRKAIVSSPPLSCLQKSGHSYATEQSYTRVVKKKVEVHIVSRENIKPASPTPRHLRIFKLSIIDQYYLDFYSPLLLFLPNNADNINPCVDEKRSRSLKESLSDVLTRFYPFAGEIKDDLHIECNDKGVLYVEARVNQTLKEFLSQPDDQKFEGVNVFDCGGIGLCTNLSHKIVDGLSYITFMKAWVATTRGSPEKISPSFMASEVFPNNPSLKYSLPSKFKTTKTNITKRFVFDSRALASLKAETVSPPFSAPTRVEASTALIWKVAAIAACTVRPLRKESPHVLCLLVDLRKRASPPFPNESIGNLVDAAIGICFPETRLKLPTLAGQIRELLSQKTSDYIKSIKGEKGQRTLEGLLRTLNELFDMIEEGDCVTVNSMLNCGVYEIDFGWGKPVWFYVMNGGNPIVVHLNDMVKGGGVEATVSMSPEEMGIFECHPDILLYTIANPSPLQFLNDQVGASP